jgi:hypothetical protein
VLSTIPIVTCTLNVLPHGQNWTITLSVFSSTATATSAARVQFRGVDPSRANNSYMLTMSNNAASSTSKSIPITGFQILDQIDTSSTPDEPNIKQDNEP